MYSKICPQNGILLLYDHLPFRKSAYYCRNYEWTENIIVSISAEWGKLSAIELLFETYLAVTEGLDSIKYVSPSMFHSIAHYLQF